MTGPGQTSKHPPLPPTTEADRLDWLRLLRSRRVGPTTFWRLLSEHGSAAGGLAALPEVAARAGVEGYRVCPEGVVHAEMEAGARAGARLLFHGGPDYPPGLRELEDAPPMLWMIGQGALMRRPAVALVGARNASSLGARTARLLARGLAEAGWLVVSGLARGIDAEAHRAALEAGAEVGAAGGTAAVMAGGVDVVYPKENALLAAKLRDQGALLSEQPPGVQPQARHFPTRNRIVSGMAQGVVVVEAAVKSGSLITARCALDQGREVMAVPGHPLDGRAGGCNLLLRDGARLVRHAEDVIEALAPLHPIDASHAAPDAIVEVPPPPPERRSRSETLALHQRILDRLGPVPVAEDQVIRDLGSTVAQIAPALTDLELEGQLERRPGGLLSRRS
ncbi:DNA-processing protein DprA [Alloyangia pacifica]|uniref:DNA protecting protein DprA n=1 Tax=Alloyangia pacifica TaxID=311180 RepID=A0A1I6TKC5_9RHOB|nr:DNA-processing protein DprA [Alloyangia pacifica]SDH15394.1 DNA protecting protein DprA [Alloyangia pacifica]SFS89610.1 DNA protecting protein DprA [Alloyangia pacifica]